jgi:twitching motility protein PilT
LVIGTLHTNSAPRTLSRILDIAPDDMRDQMRATLAVHLRAVIAQHLVKRQSGDGRVAAVEILVNAPACAAMIREGKLFQVDGWLQTQPPETGCQSLDACLLRYVREGMVDEASALDLAEHKEILARALEREAAHE